MRTALFLLLLTPAGAFAQEASPYLPISHWSTPFLEHLIAAGRMADPSPLSRPFKVEQVVRALEAVDSSVVTGAEWAVDGRRDAPPRDRPAGPPARMRAAIRCAKQDRATPRSPAAPR